MASTVKEGPKRKGPKPKKKEYYVSSVEFREELKKYYDSGQCTHNLGSMLNKIANGLSYSPNFINYCVDDQTEALTLTGWKKHDEISKNDTVLTYSISDRVYEWSPVICISDSIYNGNMYRLEYDIETKNGQCPVLDAYVTENHKFITNTDKLVSVQNIKKYKELKLTSRYGHVEGDRPVLYYTQKIKNNIFKEKYPFNNYSFPSNETYSIKLNETGDVSDIDLIKAGYAISTIKDILYFISDIPISVDTKHINMKKEMVKNKHVWCLSTLNGNFLCKRNGTIYLTGNSYRDEMVGDALVKMYTALKNKKFNMDSEYNPFSYFTTIAFHAFINRIKKEKKYNKALDEYKQKIYEDEMSSTTDGKIYVKPGGSDECSSDEYDE